MSRTNHHVRNPAIHKQKNKAVLCKSSPFISSVFITSPSRFDSESIATITDLPLPCNKSDVEAFLDDLFDRALDPKNISKKKQKAALLSTLDQRRLQMISNSRVDPSSRRRGLSNLLPKNSSSRKSSLRTSSINHEPAGTKKKSKHEKTLPERKKRTKTKKKTTRHEQLNTNNNAAMTDNSLMSFSSDNDLILPQVGLPSRMKLDDRSAYTKHSHRPKYQVFHRRTNESNRSARNSEKTF